MHILIDERTPQPIVATHKIIIRPASPSDATQISALVEIGVQEGQLLPRTIETIAESVGDWVVAVDTGRVVGAGSLLPMTPVLAEVRSLVVAPEYRKHSLGGKIVQSLIEEAKARRIPTLFALTRAVIFFERLGFVISDKEDFPEKVWRDCSICPVRFNCDEIALVKQIK
jgi:N-acetylglutamate synthase-like GNAT family acetyltransferase